MMQDIQIIYKISYIYLYIIQYIVQYNSLQVKKFGGFYGQLIPIYRAV